MNFFSGFDCCRSFVAAVLTVRLHGGCCVLLLALSFMICGDSWAHEVSWQRLVFSDSGLASSVVIEMRQVSPVGIFPGNLRKFQSVEKEMPVRKLRNCSAVYVKTSISGLWVPDLQYERIIWFDPENMAALCRLRWSSTRPEVVKYYQWEQADVRRLKYKYHEHEDCLKIIGSSVYVFPRQAVQSGAVISEPVLILYLLSSKEFNGSWTCDTGQNGEGCSDTGPGQTRSLFVFGKKRLHRVIISRSRLCDIVDNTGSADDECRVVFKDGETSVCPPADMLYHIGTDREYEKEEHFSLLGLENHINIYVHRESGIPVKIGGWNSKVGRVELKLREAFFTGSSLGGK